MNDFADLRMMTDCTGQELVVVNRIELAQLMAEFDKLLAKKSRTKNTDLIIAADLLPNWLPLDAWNAFLDMRKKIKKPATEYAQKLLLKKLAAFYANDLDPGVILNQSIMNGWQDLYAPKEQSTAYRSNGRPSVADQNRENNAEAMRLLSLPTFADDGRTLEMEP